MTAEDAAGSGGYEAAVFEVVVVGGGQAGLAMAWHLRQRELRFIVLEAAAELGQTWRSRWDSLTLFTPPSSTRYPGCRFPPPPTPTRAETTSPTTSPPTRRRSRCPSTSRPRLSH